MPKFRIRGRVETRVTEISHEYDTVDDIIEADSLDDALVKALEEIEDEYAFAEEVEADWLGEPEGEELPETAEEIREKERQDTYRAMVAIKAPRLPLMEEYVR